MNEIEEYIKIYFSGNVEELKEIASFFKLITLNKGDFFQKEGRYSDRLGFVRSGIIREYTTVDNKEVTKWIAGENSFVVDISGFIFNQPARWNLQAITDCELYVLEKKDYREIKSTLANWDDMEKKFLVKCFNVLEDRVMMHLSMNAEERYVNFFNSNRELFNQVPLQYIASMLGMTPETLSRLRNKGVG